MASQIKEEELAEIADIIVRNDGDLDELTREADRVWGELEVRREKAG